MPYVLDLVRLATSIQLAPDRRIGAGTPLRRCSAGYRDGLDDPQPALLFGGRDLAAALCRAHRSQGGEILEDVDDTRKPRPPPAIAKALIASLPRGMDKKTVRLCSVPRKGGGSLGAAALPRGRLLARRPCVARGQGAGAVGMDLGH